MNKILSKYFLGISLVLILIGGFYLPKTEGVSYQPSTPCPEGQHWQWVDSRQPAAVLLAAQPAGSWQCVDDVVVTEESIIAAQLNKSIAKNTFNKTVTNDSFNLSTVITPENLVAGTNIKLNIENIFKFNTGSSGYAYFAGFPVYKKNDPEHQLDPVNKKVIISNEDSLTMSIYKVSNGTNTLIKTIPNIITSADGLFLIPSKICDHHQGSVYIDNWVDHCETNGRIEVGVDNWNQKTVNTLVDLGTLTAGDYKIAVSINPKIEAGIRYCKINWNNIFFGGSNQHYWCGNLGAISHWAVSYGNTHVTPSEVGEDAGSEFSNIATPSNRIYSANKLLVSVLSFTVEEPAHLPTVTVNATKTTILPGEPTTISWKSTNANVCYLSAPNKYSGMGGQGIEGNFDVNDLVSTDTFKVICKNVDALEGTGSVTVNVRDTFTLTIVKQGGSGTVSPYGRVSILANGAAYVEKDYSIGYNGPINCGNTCVFTIDKNAEQYIFASGDYLVSEHYPIFSGDCSVFDEFNKGVSKILMDRNKVCTITFTKKIGLTSTLTGTGYTGWDTSVWTTSDASGNMTLYRGEPYKLSWTSENATSCTLDGVAVSPVSGGTTNSYTANSGTKTHTLVCTGASGSAVTKTINISTPPTPLSPYSSCSADGKTGTFGWTAPSGYNTFYTRASLDGVNLGSPAWDDNFVGTSKTFTTTPGKSYYWWVHTKSPNGAWSGAIDGTINCGTGTATIASSVCSAGGGSISRLGSQVVNKGSSPVYTITPYNGYQISEIRVDGSLQPISNTYTFANIQSNKSIYVCFSPLVTHTVTESHGSGGYVTPSGVSNVTAGSSLDFNITPNAGYRINEIRLNGVLQSIINPFILSNITQNLYVWFSFITGYTITATAGPNGTISPSGITNVSTSSQITYSINPNNGYKISEIRVDGSLQPISDKYIFYQPQIKNHTIHVTFSLIASLNCSNGATNPTACTLCPDGKTVASGQSCDVAKCVSPKIWNKELNSCEGDPCSSTPGTLWSIDQSKCIVKTCPNNQKLGPGDICVPKIIKPIYNEN